jgi:multimeric flavodoxin WrbA
MKPNDENGRLPPSQRPLRVLILAGSSRRQYNCPGVDSKARTLMLRMAERLPQHFEIDYEDLSNVYGRARIQSCNACVSTSMALCVWPCNCYARHDRKEPDLMWDLDLYARLDLADAWAIVAPINWYSVPSNIKLLFDRLVCMNGGNPREDLIDHKDPEKAMALDKTAQWKELSQNHLEGRTAAFFTYGDGGGDELDDDGRPRALRHKEWFDPEAEPFDDMRAAFAPIVWQCRYSGIEVPEDLRAYVEFGRGRKYSENQAEDMVREADVMAQFDSWTDRFADFVGRKGQVPPGHFRAYGYEPPGHRREDLKLKWREIRMGVGRAPEGSSPRKQEQLGLNQDATLHPKRGEGEKLRD